MIKDTYLHKSESYLPSTSHFPKRGNEGKVECHLMSIPHFYPLNSANDWDIQSFPWLLYRSSALVAEEKSIVIAADVQFSDCGVVIKDKDRNGINMKRINGEFSLSLASEGKLQHGLFFWKKLNYWCLKYPLANEVWGKYPSKLDYFLPILQKQE